MKLRKIVFVVGLMAIFTVLTSGSLIWAGGGPEPPPPGATIHGPEIWGVVVLDCTNQLVIVRVKRVVDCVVETEAYVEEWSFGCPDNAAAALGFGPVEGSMTFFNLPGTPYVTKVKNFKTEAGLCYFDAQFMFWEE
ncbi:hypothetical protein KA005_59745 [bacterium]|nr:hypothetical protein [bacterium]